MGSNPSFSHPRIRYSLLRAKQILRCVWTKIIAALAVRTIVILYALLRFLANRCRTE